MKKFLNPSILFEKLARPLARLSAAKNFTIKKINAVELTIVLISSFMIYMSAGRKWTFLLFSFALALVLIFDAVIRVLDKEHHLQSSGDKFLTEVISFVSETALYIPLLAVRGIPELWLGMIIILTLVSEAAGLAALQIGSKHRHDGPLEKNGRLILFMVLGLLMGSVLRPGIWVGAVFIPVIILLFRTVFNRISRPLKDQKMLTGTPAFK